jgi:signal transduction histidine kinase
MLEEQVRERTVELVQADKLATVGRLAAGVAHEINSPLGVLASNLDMLEHMVRNPASVHSMELVDDIARSSAEATSRLSWVVKTFETFAGLDEAEFKSVNINSLIDEVLVFSRNEMSEGIKVERKFENLDPIWCSPGRLRQALLNLVSNAIGSIEGEGTIYFETARQAEFAKLTIRDSGKGMSPDQLAKVFDGEFNTKGDRVGLSMGLLVTAQIVRSHHGDLKIESEVGEGTTVTILLPFK